MEIKPRNFALPLQTLQNWAHHSNVNTLSTSLFTCVGVGVEKPPLAPGLCTTLVGDHVRSVALECSSESKEMGVCSWSIAAWASLLSIEMIFYWRTVLKRSEMDFWGGREVMCHQGEGMCWWGRLVWGMV